MQCLSADERRRAIGLIEAGVPMANVAKLLNCSRETIYNLQSRARRPVQRTDLRLHHRQTRLLWANNHRVSWTGQQWSQVLLTDESRFVISRYGGRMCVYRCRNERFEDQCVHESSNRGYGQTVVWGGITTDHRTALVHIPAD
ncbi:transposable element tcb1 transposase [Plakobranchus ocellatus]|uniref:Transposable element tcb1 transposase n=1 Tax=Plakobranchus ocellatus TaxID=259542 RepID=A0AAV4CV53_9GAST|nr:transposable element tcb1 transposase [Plakobranchus ocellatus]